MAYYVCSDLHGYPLEELQDYLDNIGFGKNDYLYVLGDVIDRGPDGIKILKWLMRTHNACLILGNHELMLLDCDFLFDDNTEDIIRKIKGTKRLRYKVWMSNCGKCTLDALNGLRDEEIKYILEYLRNAPLYKTLTVNENRFILSHAGLGNFKKDKELSDYTIDELLWNRPDMDQSYFDDAIVVFGHTPTFCYGDQYQGKSIIRPTWINIDVGAGYGFRPMLLRLEDMQEFYFRE